ncbi:hypothetical protein FB468_2420 [Leucobacter komagatae]|uniref:Uncharacterized protein n=1 Tax=Leucobacter komagatae TaxID=55969 RepID=A0A542Y8E2_9MICO|nr:hypothetical protein [Leucobacter komagatae]TQL44363.1 hypothetical protein FB468_2420 [Leucobacter komagatae]
MVEATDNAGMTRAEVAELTLQEEYELYGERYDRAHELLADAQLQISEGPWIWGETGLLPHSGYAGGVRGTTLPGSDGDTSYDVTDSRVIDPKDTNGAAQLETMRRYYKANGWPVEEQVGSDWITVWGRTDDGYWLGYTVREPGTRYLVVRSELYWTNDQPALESVISDLTPGSFADGTYPRESLPGDYIPFPNWPDAVTK